MGLSKKFREQWAKVERTQKRIEERTRELRNRSEGYKDEGIYFSHNIQEKLVNSAQYWEKLRGPQCVELLRLHARMIEEGKSVDPKFDRARYEQFAKA